MPRSSSRAGSENKDDSRLEAERSGERQPFPSDSARTMLIGEVAAATGLTQRTLRYYEEIGLLPQSQRLEGGFRHYTETDIASLRRITELKRLLGFSLVEIKALIEMDDERRERRSAYHRAASPDERRTHVNRSLDLARQQLVKLDQRLAGLLEMRTKTEERIRRYVAELERISSEVEQQSTARPIDRQTGQDAT